MKFQQNLDNNLNFFLETFRTDLINEILNNYIFFLLNYNLDIFFFFLLDKLYQIAQFVHDQSFL
jgi:hypothetical protein